VHSERAHRDQNANHENLKDEISKTHHALLEGWLVLFRAFVLQAFVMEFLEGSGNGTPIALRPFP
jgi:hypothetical protein